MNETLRRKKPELVVTGLILLFAFVLLAPRIFIVIGPGEAGVLYSPLTGGTEDDYIYTEGLAVIWPWDRMYIYNTRIQQTKRTLDVLTKDGVTLRLALSVRFQPDRKRLPYLHQDIGPGYVESVVVPEVLSAARQQIGNVTADELYTGNDYPQLPVNAVARAAALIAPVPQTPGVALPPPVLTPQAGQVGIDEAFDELAGTLDPNLPRLSVGELPNDDRDGFSKGMNETLIAIVDDARKELSRSYLILDDVVLLETKLPQIVDLAIQAKMEQKQRAEAQLFRIQYAQREVMLRQFDAQANTVLDGSLTPALLTWKGIEASKELAAAPNSKVIVIGNGADNLPVILGGGTTP